MEEDANFFDEHVLFLALALLEDEEEGKSPRCPPRWWWLLKATSGVVCERSVVDISVCVFDVCK